MRSPYGTNTAIRSAVINVFLSLAYVLSTSGPLPEPPDPRPVQWHISGWLSQYGQQPTDATITYRQERGEIPIDLSGYAGVIALEHCQHVGHEATLTVDGEAYRVMVFDCLNPEHDNPFAERGWAAEAGYYLADELGIVGRGGVWAEVEVQ